MDMNNLGHSAALSGALVMSEVTLGTSFKIGFTLHNITKALATQHRWGEGKTKNQIVDPLEQGTIAGAPTIVDA
jgi:hypothetical protein